MEVSEAEAAEAIVAASGGSMSHAPSSTRGGAASSSTEGPAYAFKVVLLGEGRVGKTSLLVRYARDEFEPSQPPTIQAAFLSKRIRVDGAVVEMNVWDTAGQERFHALGPIYYRDADAALLVFDITDVDSFERCKKWVEELRSVRGNKMALAIAGNKIDMEKARAVPAERAERYAASLSKDGVGGEDAVVRVYGTSAKQNRGVEQCFEDIARALVRRSKRSVGSRRTAGHGYGATGGASAFANSGKRGGLVISSEPPPPVPRNSSCC